MHTHGVVKIRISLQRPLKVKAGQYINLWIPSVSFWSFMQSHPFVVISWADGPWNTLDLLVEPRKGLTRELLHHAKNDNIARSRLVLFSGPHGASVEMRDYKTVVMIASGFGIAAHLPYLRRLIHGYNSCEIRVHRIHLVWQVQDLEVGIAAQPLLNDVLDEDKLDEGCILNISIYLESNDIPKVSFGKRATVYPGIAPLKDIIQAEAVGKQAREMQEQGISGDTIPVFEEELEFGRSKTTTRKGKMLVTGKTDCSTSPAVLMNI
ncbi:MAG: hypothetical protein M1812_005837 [Candelaria pacifica]|nr:MAG: hypothetical protein M1812_005837 [Candelaria pacifica]